MNPFVKKEIRLLLPGFLTGIVLALSNFLLPDFGISSPVRGVLVVFPFLCCPAMVVVMALNSFGSEISFGTFSNLLAQPVPRKQIWRVKICLLAGALFIVGSLWCLFFYFRYAPFKDPNNPQDFGDVLISAGTFLMVVFSGALWTVLLIRQVAAAFWFTLLTPALILVLTAGLNTVMADAPAEWIRVTLLGGYSVAGLWFARWLFLCAQDTQWTGGTISLPEIHGLPRWFARTGVARRWRPRAALWRKELQLHQSQLIIAGILALLHAIVVLTRKCGHFPKNSVTEFILETFWVLWLAMPMLVGCAAMAEERKMATLESQLCLPVKRWTQFRIKFLVVLMFSALLGTMIPWLLEGNRILPGFILNGALSGVTGDGNVGRIAGHTFFLWNPITRVTWLVVFILLNFLAMAAICAGVAALAFFGSSLSRNTLQALAPSMLGLVLAWFLSFVASRPYDLGLGFLWRGPLFYLITAPVMIVVMAALAYGNCQRMRITGIVWLKNLLTLVAALALVTAATSAIYHRSWELISADEPAHGPARWTITHPPRLQINGRTITVLLPDGRVWMDRYTPETSPLGVGIVEDRGFGGGRLLEGTNWTDVRDYFWDIVGVQRDGSLWLSLKPDQVGHLSQKAEEKLAPGAAGFERFGNGHDWKNISGRNIMPFLLKSDGTLWFWGANNSKQAWPGLHAFIPKRLGADCDWEKVFADNGRTFLMKTNGEVWVYPPFDTTYETKALSIGSNSIHINRAPYLEKRPWTDVEALYIGSTLVPCLVGIFEDGTFRQIVSDDLIPTPRNFSNSLLDRFVPKDVQIGRETNWLAVAGNNGAFGFNTIAVTLKTDGTLWKWNFYPGGYRPRNDFWEKPPDLPGTYPTAFSTHSDWVAIGEMMGCVVSLAADGSLYLWRFESPVNYDSEWKGPLLQVSRRPVLLGNVFSQTN
jgi:ABC-type transport system involved in multi-copper enzyme maturation permease subunit